MARDLDSTKYVYKHLRTVNHCECQKGNSEVFVFKDLHATMVWSGAKEQAGNIVVAHCAGRFDFQFLFCDYLMHDG